MTGHTNSKFSTSHSEARAPTQGMVHCWIKRHRYHNEKVDIRHASLDSLCQNLNMGVGPVEALWNASESQKNSAKVSGSPVSVWFAFPGRLLNRCLLLPHPLTPPVALRWAQRICTCTTFPDNAEAAGLETTNQEPQLCIPWKQASQQSRSCFSMLKYPRWLQWALEGEKHWGPLYPLHREVWCCHF